MTATILVVDDEPDLEAEDEPEVVGGEHVGRVGDGDHDDVVREGDRQSAEPPRHRLGKEARGRRIDVGARELQVLETVLLGQRGGDLSGRREAVPDEDLAEPAPRSPPSRRGTTRAGRP